MKRKEYFVRSSHIKYSFSSWNFFLITREKSSRQSLLLKCYIKLLVVNWYRVIPTLWLSIISRLCELTRWNNLYLRELMAYIWYRNGGNVRVSLDNCSCFLFHCPTDHYQSGIVKRSGKIIVLSRQKDSYANVFPFLWINTLRADNNFTFDLIRNFYFASTFFYF